MFETLGYECRKSENAIQYLSECGKEITFIFELHRFYKQRNFISLNIDIDEFKAIHQQMKELGWLEEEQKQETNFEHYFKYLSTIKMCDLALIGGRVTKCLGTGCSECDFNGDCIERKFKWLKQPYEKTTFKLTQFEFDLLNAHKDSGMQKCISNYRPLLELHEKGYFKDVDTSVPIHKILENCEIKGDEKND
ncbi:MULTISPECIES: hypothetical protein [unclassified Holdemanella]|uniref:hypothetical protein n=1 Tax=unclassified Holdemanella TaxID=2633909 RepID=UPI001D09A099|nr:MULTISPECIES: hypothetical protein [unclassified Holdemanella]MCB8640064.1 hypothetical protein [Holdemanella sp. DFI.5.55]MCG5648794.1 hypothetical protein [Holdemanella sp. DFI.5.21]